MVRSVLKRWDEAFEPLSDASKVATKMNERVCNRVPDLYLRPDAYEQPKADDLCLFEVVSRGK